MCAHHQGQLAAAPGDWQGDLMHLGLPEGGGNTESRILHHRTAGKAIKGYTKILTICLFLYLFGVKIKAEYNSDNNSLILDIQCKTHERHSECLLHQRNDLSTF